MSKRFQMIEFKGSTQEKQFSEIFRFGYRKAANDKMVPDPVGSGVFVLQKLYDAVVEPEAANANESLSVVVVASQSATIYKPVKMLKSTDTDLGQRRRKRLSPTLET